MQLRKTLLMTCGMLIAAILAALALLLQGVDLDDYRQQVERQLSTALARPVRLGESRFSLRHGPAFSFSDVRLEPTGAGDWSLTAERLYLRLEFLPLLHRQLRFHRMVLHAPRLHLPLSPGATPSSSPDLTGGFPEIRSLVVRDGMLLVEDRRESPHPPVVIEGIEGNLVDFAPGQPGWLTLRGRLRQPDGGAEMRLAGEIVPDSDWRRLRGRLALKVENWSPAPVVPLFWPGAQIAGDGSLQLTLAGSAADGVRFEADLAGNDLTLAPPDWRREPLPIPAARLRGTWTAVTEGGRLDDLEFVLDRIAAHGTLAWRNDGETLLLDASLSTPRLPIPELLPWLPDHPATDRLREEIRDGFLEIRSARFAGPAETLRRPDGHFPLEADFAIDALTLHAAGQELRQIAADAVVRDGRIVIPRGGFLFRGAPVRFSGSITDPLGSSAFTVTAEGKIESSHLLAISEDLAPELEVNGAAGVQVSAGGTAESINVKLRADLAPVQVRRGPQLLKATGESGDLLIGAEVTGARVKMGELRLRLPALEIKAGGHLDRHPPHRFRIEADLAADDLKTLRPKLALLETLQANGALALHLELAGDRGEIRSRSGWLRLKKTDLHLTGAVADLHEAVGEISFAGDRLEFDQVTALLGTSPVVLAGRAENLADPVVHLGVRAKAIRADELIFRSPTIHLRDVEGDLRIDKHGILFERVEVRLDGGTRARISGSADFAEPRVGLEIEAEEGNIDEVIALWQGPPPAPKEGERRGVRVEITARVGEGRIGPLRFQQAEGMISHHDGELSIFPLRFSSGGGRGTGRIVVATAETPARLHVSGHVEGIDAAAAHLDLLQRRGLVTGLLSGDFQVEGEIGEKFLETSTGTIKVEIEHGVLRKFKALAKVFSLLNVSQIFTLQLPDMARDGMPFNRVTGNFRLQQGLLTTEDLFVESEAMNLSLIGEMNLRTEMLDFVLGVKPLRTVDKIVTRIPLAGWILAGEEKALITAHFLVRGGIADAEVVPVPITSISEKVVGIFRRVFGLPGKVIEGVGELVRPD